MFEVEEQNNRNRWEAGQLERALAEVSSRKSLLDPDESRRLQGRRREVLEAIEANDESRRLMGLDIEANELTRRGLQQQLDEDVTLAAKGGVKDRETLFLALQQRMQSAQMIELRFQMA
eukprot:8291301-Pyramimonas_sp.AAC.1